MMNKIEIPKQEWIIRYHSKSDGKVIKRPYDPHSEMQYEFIAKSTGKLCKRYFDAVKGETRTANAPWTITIVNTLFYLISILCLLLHNP